MKYYQVTYLIRGTKYNKIIQANDRNDAIAKVKKSTRGTLLKIREISPPLEERLLNLLAHLLKCPPCARRRWRYASPRDSNRRGP